MAATRTKEKKTAPAVRASHTGPHPPISANLGNGIWQTNSWTREDQNFEQDLNARTCTCEAGQKGLWCRHLTSAMLSSLTLQIGKARAADGPVLRALLKKSTHGARPDIEMALLLVIWEESKEAWARLQAPDPTDETPPEGGGVPLTPEQYGEAVQLLSEARRAA